MGARSAGSSGEAGSAKRRRVRFAALTLAVSAGCSLAFPVDDRFLANGDGGGGAVVLADGAVLLPDGAVVQPDGAVVPQCADSFKACGGTCVAIADPAFGCSATGCDPCPGSDTAAFRCDGNVCKVQSCTGARLDCDQDSKNGCEVDPNTDPTQCGGCANPPPNAPAGAECCSGVCNGGTCAPETGATTLIPTLDRPSDLLLDPGERAVFYATVDNGVGKIVRWDAVTKTTSTIADNLGFVSAMVLAGTDEIVFADQAVGRIARVKRDGTGPPTTIAGGYTSPRGLAIDGTRLYWAQGTLSVTYDGNILTADLATDAGATEFLPNQADVRSIAAMNGRVGLGLEIGDTVRLCELDGGIHEATNEQRPLGLQFVGTDLVWGDRATSEVRRFPNGGTGAATKVANQGNGLGAVSHRGDRVFFADMNGDSADCRVFSSALDGSDLRTLVAGGLPGPAKLAATKTCVYILAEGRRVSYNVVPSTGGLFRVKWTP